MKHLHEEITKCGTEYSGHTWVFLFTITSLNGDHYWIWLLLWEALYLLVYDTFQIMINYGQLMNTLEGVFFFKTFFFII